MQGGTEYPIVPSVLNQIFGSLAIAANCACMSARSVSVSISSIMTYYTRCIICYVQMFSSSFVAMSIAILMC